MSVSKIVSVNTPAITQLVVTTVPVVQAIN